jgi:hypothetical protein
VSTDRRIGGSASPFIVVGLSFILAGIRFIAHPPTRHYAVVPLSYAAGWR